MIPMAVSPRWISTLTRLGAMPRNDAAEVIAIGTRTAVKAALPAAPARAEWIRLRLEVPAVVSRSPLQDSSRSHNSSMIRSTADVRWRR